MGAENESSQILWRRRIYRTVRQMNVLRSSLVIGLLLFVWLLIASGGSDNSEGEKRSIDTKEDGFSPIRIMRRSLGIAHASCKKLRSVVEKLKGETAGFVQETAPANMSAEQACQVFKDEAEKKRQYWMNVLGGKCEKTEDGRDITFVTHISYNRMYMLERIAAHWQGPMSVAIDILPENFDQLVENFCASEMLQLKENLMIHLSIKQGEFYPANFIRTVALNGSCTSYVFLSDGDFVPVQNSELRMMEYIKDHGVLAPGEKHAVVLPAFELLRDGTAFPREKRDVIDLWKEKQLRPFHLREWPPGHSATLFPYWKIADKIYRIKWRRQFEPYLIMRSDEVPAYNQEFVGRFFDKVSHAMEIAARGFQFLVTPDLYTVHLPHPVTSDVKNADLYMGCAIRLHFDFKKRLKEQFNATL